MGTDLAFAHRARPCYKVRCGPETRNVSKSELIETSVMDAPVMPGIAFSLEGRSNVFPILSDIVDSPLKEFEIDKEIEELDRHLVFSDTEIIYEGNEILKRTFESLSTMLPLEWSSFFQQEYINFYKRTELGGKLYGPEDGILVKGAGVSKLAFIFHYMEEAFRDPVAEQPSESIKVLLKLATKFNQLLESEKYYEEPEKAKLIALYNLYFFAPFVSFLNIPELEVRIKDNAFKVLSPAEYLEAIDLRNSLISDDSKDNNKSEITSKVKMDEIVEQVSKALTNRSNGSFYAYGREKSLLGIYIKYLEGRSLGDIRAMTMFVDLSSLNMSTSDSNEILRNMLLRLLAQKDLPYTVEKFAHEEIEYFEKPYNVLEGNTIYRAVKLKVFLKGDNGGDRFPLEIRLIPVKLAPDSTLYHGRFKKEEQTKRISPELSQDFPFAFESYLQVRLWSSMLTNGELKFNSKEVVLEEWNKFKQRVMNSFTINTNEGGNLIFISREKFEINDNLYNKLKEYAKRINSVVGAVADEFFVTVRSNGRLKKYKVDNLYGATNIEEFNEVEGKYFPISFRNFRFQDGIFIEVRYKKDNDNSSIVPTVGYILHNLFLCKSKGIGDQNEGLARLTDEIVDFTGYSKEKVSSYLQDWMIKVSELSRNPTDKDYDFKFSELSVEVKEVVSLLTFNRLINHERTNGKLVDEKKLNFIKFCSNIRTKSAELLLLELFPKFQKILDFETLRSGFKDRKNSFYFIDFVYKLFVLAKNYNRLDIKNAIYNFFKTAKEKMSLIQLYKV